MIICSPQLGMSPEANLGGEVYDREILAGLDKLGVKSVIVLPLWKKHPSMQNAKFYSLPIPFVYPPWIFNLLVLPYLFYLHSKSNFDILRVHSPYYAGPAALLFKFFYPAVKIVPSYLHLEPRGKFQTWIDKTLLKQSSLVATISSSTKQDIISDFDVPTDKIAVVSPGVEKKYQPKEKNQRLLKKYDLEGKIVLLYLGQLIARKNIPFLFDVLKGLPSDYCLLICGDGPLREEFKEMVQKQKLSERVIFTGTVPENEKVDVYNLADIFLYPSKIEGFGLSVCEALACGKTVIANDIPVFREITASGLILLPIEAKVWIETILKTKNLKSKPKISYTWERAAKKYQEELLKIL